MKIQKWLLIGGVVILVGAAALAALSFAAPLAWAQGPGDGGGPMFGGGFGPGPGMGGGPGMMPGGAFDFGRGPGGMIGMGGRWGGPENSLISIAAEKLGITTDELVAELQAGKSIADVAGEKNVSVDTIVDAVIATRTDRLNELVANGQLTQEQADAMLAEMKTRVTERINQPGLPQGRGFGFFGNGGCDRSGMGGRMGGRFGGPENSLIAVVTEKLGLTRAELITELQAGKSIADVAQEKDVSLDTMVDAVLAPRTDRLNELVANGQLTQEEVNNRLSNLRVDLIDRLNQNWAAPNTAPSAEPDGLGNY